MSYERYSRRITEANEQTTHETDRVTALMIEQSRAIVKLGNDLAALLAVEPETLTGPECDRQANAIVKCRTELIDTINTLATRPVVTQLWAETVVSFLGIESYYASRHQQWKEEQRAELERRERADAYHQQCTREQELHERRLRGDLV